MAVFVTPARFALIVADDFDVTLAVLTLNVEVVFPAAIVTLDGTVADDRLLESETDNPPEGAGDEIVTVPVEVLPPVTEVGVKESDFRAGEFTTTVAVRFVPFRAAVTVTVA